MHPLHAFVLICLLLSACSTHIRLSHLEPSVADLTRGTSLSISAADDGMVDAMVRSLEKERFYHLRPDGTAHLYVGPLRASTSWDTVHTCTDPEDCTCTPDSTVTVTGTVQLVNRSRHVMSKEFSGSGDTNSTAKEDLANRVATAMVPHVVTNTYSISPASGNDGLVAAADACANGNWRLGRTLATQALRTYPADPEGHYLMGLIERRDENWDKAIAHLRRARDMRPSFDYTKALAETFRMQQDTPKARKQLKGAPPPPPQYLVKERTDEEDDASSLAIFTLLLDILTLAL